MKSQQTTLLYVDGPGKTVHMYKDETHFYVELSIKDSNRKVLGTAKQKFWTLPEAAKYADSLIDQEDVETFESLQGGDVMAFEPFNKDA